MRPGTRNSGLRRWTRVHRRAAWPRKSMPSALCSIPMAACFSWAAKRGVSYLYHVNDDGTGLRKLLPGPVSFLYAISPDGKAVAVWAANGAWTSRPTTEARRR